MLLDPNDPESKRVFLAMALEDKLIDLCRALTTIAFERRQSKLTECRVCLDDMRELCRQDFENSPELQAAIDKFEKALSDLALAQDTATKGCLVCGGETSSIQVSANEFSTPFCKACFKNLRGPLSAIRLGFELDSE